MAMVVEPVDECLDFLDAILHVHITMPVDVLVLDGAPEPLDIYIV